MLTIRVKQVGDKRSAPYHVGDDNIVLRQDVWQGDPFAFLGVQRTLRKQEVETFAWQITAENAADQVGLFPVFSRTPSDGREAGVYVLTLPIESIEVWSEEKEARYGALLEEMEAL